MTNYNIAGDMDDALVTLRECGGCRIVVAGTVYEVRLSLTDDNRPYLMLDDVALLVQMDGFG